MLEDAITQAKTSAAKALAYYKLGVFHDNNSREAEAIPNYEKALKLGLEPKIKAQALAWLSSSLYKTDKLEQALRRLNKSLAITTDAKLKKFLIGLERRINRRLVSGF